MEREARHQGRPTGLRTILPDRGVKICLFGTAVDWFLLDFVYYGNTIASPAIVKLVAPPRISHNPNWVHPGHFAVAALPAYFLAAATIDKIGRRPMQGFGFLAISLALFLLWAVPGAAETVAPFLLLFGATYFFAEFGHNTTTFVYPAEISLSGCVPRLIGPPPRRARWVPLLALMP